jgi:peptide methionine sulfoxide reductase MsrA
MKDYKGFIITESKYIEESHPQYNYLAFRAENNKGQYTESVFHDLDLKMKTYDELLNIFLRNVNNFINKLEGII